LIHQTVPSQNQNATEIRMVAYMNDISIITNNCEFSHMAIERTCYVWWCFFFNPRVPAFSTDISPLLHVSKNYPSPHNHKDAHSFSSCFFTHLLGGFSARGSMICEDDYSCSPILIYTRYQKKTICKLTSRLKAIHAFLVSRLIFRLHN
jgi:hypothetical protein